jgi:hypothetical protein
VPEGRVVVVSVPEAKASPWLVAPPITVTGLPKFVPFTWNCIVPVGSCEALAVAKLVVLTVAVSVTLVPTAIDDWFDAAVVVVGSLVMVRVSVLVLGL